MGFQAGVNFYQYVENNPVNFNDPSGMESLITDSGFAGLSTNPNASTRELLFAAGMTVAPVAPFAIKAAIPSVVAMAKSLSVPGVIAGTGGVVGHVATTEKVTLGSGAKSFAVGYVGGSIMGPAFGSVASKFIANPLTSNLVANTTNAASGSALGQLALGGSVDPVGVGISMLSAIPSTLFLSEVAASGIATTTAHSIAGEAISTGYSIIGSRLASSLQRLGGNSASGGFALYPNKSNSNVMQTVYAK
uniref:RHS repeat-associated core domain-containing protein n=1 Tax=Candidatus Kentrum sp. LFY TaxID=2126342 RepID=A0A450UPK0_9GAMM|nr:MAG: hypothetical protein BECKLFY1418B_GA0070995_105819 [Candidatus Kentron sp. LFY]